MSQLTTHILDTTIGKPAANVEVILYYHMNSDWKEVARTATDADGRVNSLPGCESPMDTGIYKFKFETKEYFNKQNIKTFYPFVEIVFEITTTSHYHVPLLLNPFGFSTYRGS